MRVRDIRFLSIGGCLILGVGCGAPRLPDYAGPSVSGSAPARSAESDGIAAIVDPFTDEERSEKFFGMDALENGILILHLRVENRSSDQTWLLGKESCKLLSSGGAAQAAPGGKSDVSAAEAVSLVGFAVVSIPLLMVGNSLLSQSTEIQRNLTTKELTSRTISPGQAAEGFVYYSIDEDLPRFQGELRISLTSTKTREIVTLSTPVTYAGR